MNILGLILVLTGFVLFVVYTLNIKLAIENLIRQHTKELTPDFTGPIFINIEPIYKQLFSWSSLFFEVFFLILSGMFVTNIVSIIKSRKITTASN
jgi:uncharacterized membrane protein